MNEESVIISDPGRRHPIVVQRRDTGGVAVYAKHMTLALSDDESARLASFITGKPCIQRYAVATPSHARFEQVDD